MPCPCKSLDLDDPVAVMVVNMKSDGKRNDSTGVYDIRFEASASHGNYEEGQLQSYCSGIYLFCIVMCCYIFFYNSLRTH